MDADVRTVKVRGEGGAEWDMDLPDPASIAGLRFRDMVELGLLVVIEGEIPDDAPEPAPSGLDGMKVDELKAFADDLDIDLAGATKKADIIAAIEAGGAPEDDDES